MGACRSQLQPPHPETPLLTNTKAPHHTSPAVPSLWGLWVSPRPHIGVPHGAGVQGCGDNFLWLGTLGATGVSQPAGHQPWRLKPGVALLLAADSTESQPWHSKAWSLLSGGTTGHGEPPGAVQSWDQRERVGQCETGGAGIKHHFASPDSFNINIYLNYKTPIPATYSAARLQLSGLTVTAPIDGRLLWA